jgi:hypothetical protein
MIYRGPVFLAVYGLTPPRHLLHPLPLSSQYAVPATQRKTEKPRQLADGIGGEGGGRGAESYNCKKTRSSLNHSILAEEAQKKVTAVNF